MGVKEVKKVFISQPMRGKTSEEILAARDKAFTRLQKYLPEYELILIDSLIAGVPDANVKNKSVWYLGKSIQLLSEADIMLGPCNYLRYAGCNIETEVARAYGIQRYRLGNDGSIYEM